MSLIPIVSKKSRLGNRKFSWIKPNFSYKWKATFEITAEPGRQFAKLEAKQLNYEAFKMPIK